MYGIQNVGIVHALAGPSTWDVRRTPWRVGGSWLGRTMDMAMDKAPRHSVKGSPKFRGPPKGFNF